MKYSLTFVRIKNEQHFHAVCAAYGAVGIFDPTGFIQYEYVMSRNGTIGTDFDCGLGLFCNMKLENPRIVELILKNGKLVAKPKSTNSRRSTLTFTEDGTLVGFSNILTKAECERLAPGYITDERTGSGGGGVRTHYYLENGKIVLIDMITRPIEIGDKIDKYRIGLLKQAGDRFVEFRKAAMEPKLITVEI
jgi:hypothetical protein